MTESPAPPPPVPTGTVTFLLTDVVRSTQGWQDEPDAMAAAVAQHDAILDDAISRHSGARPVEQGEGDSTVSAFAHATAALHAALDAQRMLQDTRWPDGAALSVRMGLHTGEARLRDAGNYVGEAIIRCARLRDIGHGGQVLCSDATAALARNHLPDGASLLDLGVQHLKQLSATERVWQLCHPDLAASFPALRSTTAPRSTLPVPLTPLVGRDAAMTEVAGLFARGRCVTLTGSGGVGKTRLAIAVAADLVAALPGGAWWVDLAPVADPRGVGRMALAALGAPDHPSRAPDELLAAALGDAPALLVLDNCEHLVDACAELASELLQTCGSVSVLATSREPLGIAGEVTWRVPSLATPRDDEPVEVADLLAYDAVRLFVDAARRARPSFALDIDNAAAVAQICRRLDGIPLAVELAAARCRQMPVEHLAQAMDDRFRLLTGGGRTTMARQQTLAASLEWSHDLLDDLEQRVFRRLGVFAGAFALDAAEQVVASVGDIEPLGVFDVMCRLVDKSLVVADEGAGALRYRLLETVRAYALDHARRTNELAGLRDAHAQWCLAWLDEIGASEPTDGTVDAVEDNHANILAALDWVDGGRGLELLGRLGRAWTQSGRVGVTLDMTDRWMFDPDVERAHPSAWLEAAMSLGGLLIQAGRGDDFAMLLERVRIRAEAEDDRLAAAWQRWFSSGLAAPESVEVRERAHEQNRPFLVETCGNLLAMAAADFDPSAARPCLEAAEATVAAADRGFTRRGSERARMMWCAATGDLSRAIELGHRLVDDRSPTTAVWGITALSRLGLAARDTAAVQAAITATDRMLVKARDLAPPDSLARHAAELLDGAGSTMPADAWPAFTWPDALIFQWIGYREIVDVGAGELAVHRTRQLAETSQPYAFGSPGIGPIRVVCEDGSVRVEQLDGPAPLPAAVAAAIEGAATGDEERWHDALRLALGHELRLVAVDALEAIAVGAARSENWAEALRLLGAARRLRDETGYRWRYAGEQRAVDDARSAARAASGEAAPDLEREGGELDWLEAGAYAQRARGERNRPSHGWESLTPTEARVVAAVAEGLTNPQVAQRCMMSRSTVKTHLEHIYTKLGIRNRTELASEAARRGVT